jgi:O-antigen ligase
MFKLTYISFYFVALGVFTSVTVPSLHHILAIVPFIYFTYRYLFKDKKKLPKSAWVIIIFTLWSYTVNLLHFENLQNPISDFGKEKYQLFAIMMLASLFYMKEYLTVYRWRKILYVFWGTIILAAVYGIFSSQFLTDSYGYRNSGFTETMRYGYGTSFVASMLFALIPFRDELFAKFLNKNLFWLTLILAVLGLYFSKTRGGILGLCFSFPFIFYFVNKRYFKISLIVFLLLSLSVGYIVTFSGGGSSRLFSKLGSPSNMMRLSQYETAFKTSLESPITGYGNNTFSNMCKSRKEKYNIYYPNYCVDYHFLDCDLSGAKPYCSHSHNLFLENAVEKGWPGAVLLLLFFLVWAYEMLKKKDLMTVVFIAFISNFLIASQFEYTFHANNLFMIFFLYPISYMKLPERYNLKVV